MVMVFMQLRDGVEVGSKDFGGAGEKTSVWQAAVITEDEVELIWLSAKMESN